MLYVSKEFNKIVKEKYEEMKKSGLTEDFLNKEFFGDMKLFINPEKKIESSLVKVRMSNKDVVHVGSNESL